VPKRISKVVAALVMAAGVSVIGASVVGGIALAADHGSGPVAVVDDPTDSTGPAGGAAPPADADEDGDAGSRPDADQHQPTAGDDDADDVDGCHDDCTGTDDETDDDQEHEDEHEDDH
jgi:hypothetical protein